MFSIKNKITSLFWIAILGLFLTTIYSILLGFLGYRTMDRIDYLYKGNKEHNKEHNKEN